MRKIKLLTLMLIASLACVCFVACGDNKEDEPEIPNQTETPAQKEEVEEKEEVRYYVKYEVYMPLGYGGQTTSRQITYVSEKGTNQITIGEKSWEGTFGPLKKGAKLSLKATAISGGIWIDTDYYVKISVSRDKEPFVLKAEDRKIESGILEASYTINF